MRKQVSEPRETLPLRRRGGQTLIECHIENEVVANCIRQCPQVSDCIAVAERLREVPELSRHYKWPQRMRNGKGLTELRAPDISLRLFVKYAVDIDVSAAKVLAPEKCHSLQSTANVSVGCCASVQASNVGKAERRLQSCSRQHNHLHTGRYPTRLSRPTPASSLAR